MKYNYSIGVDIGKNKLDVFVTRGEKKVTHTTISNDKKGFKVLQQALKKAQVPLSEALFCAVDRGYYTYPLLTWIRDNKLDLWLERPVAIKKSNELVSEKSDTVDAESMASYAYKNQDSCDLWLPPRGAIDTLQKLSWLKETLLGFIHEYSFPPKEIDDKEISNPFKNISIAFKKDLEALEKKISICIKKDDDMSRFFNILISVPGIGSVTANALIAATNGFTKITEPRRMAYFIGIAPTEHTSERSVSGKHRFLSFTSKKLKKMLRIAAMTAIRSPGELTTFYERLIAKGKAEQIVINVLCRKLIDRIYACVKRDQKYNKNYTRELSTS